jgi:hypothetical protein
LYLNKESLQGPGKKIKVLWYGHFEVLKKVGDNAYRLGLHPYMHIYSIVNLENLKLYEPFLLDREINEKVLRTIEDLALKYQAKSLEDIVFQKNYKTTK